MHTTSHHSNQALTETLEEELEWKAQVIAAWIDRQNIGLGFGWVYPWVLGQLHQEPRFRQLEIIALRKTLLDMVEDKLVQTFDVRDALRSHGSTSSPSTYINNPR